MKNLPCLAFALLLVGYAHASYSFSMQDVVGDENVIYPLSEEWQEVAGNGIFDILSFSVSAENASLLDFSIELGSLLNPLDAPLGFSFPIIQIYIHSSPPGSFRVLKDGISTIIGNGNFKLDHSYTWTGMIELNGWSGRFLRYDGTSIDLSSDTISTEENTIRIQLEEHQLGMPVDFWSYSLLVGAYLESEESISSFHIIDREASETRFGGGDDSSANSNLIDILIPTDSVRSQSHVLYNYCASTSQLVTIHPMSGLQRPYLRGEPITVENEEGGIGCIHSAYQTGPQLRYEVESTNENANEWTITYVESEENLQELGTDQTNLSVTVELLSNCILRLVIQDTEKERYQLPLVRDDQNPLQCDYNVDLFDWEIQQSPFSLKVSRKDTNEVLFDSQPSQSVPFRNLVFKDKYIEFSTHVPSHATLYGLGERITSLALDRNDREYTIHNIDRGTPEELNLYGSHPFYLDLREENAHGVFMANNLGMDVILTDERLTYKMIGGIIDLYFFLGPTVDDVVKQYHSIIGKPILPPYWALGFHQSRWGYVDTEEMQYVVDQFKENELPLDTMWSDIDYMDEKKLWTLDPIHYADSIHSFVDDLHDNDQHYVMIIDPGVKIEANYAAYEDGTDRNIFIQTSSSLTNQSTPFIGKVWPGFVAFIDFCHPDATPFWYDHMHDFHEQVPFDGIWIDMNEIASFCDGHCNLESESIGTLFECSCSQPEYNELDFPPYLPGGDSPGMSTISMASMHYDNVTEYNIHNLYGYMEAKATHEVLERLLEKRSFVLTRSSFAGSGHHTAHWLGDNAATWDDMRQSIAGIINMNMFGVPMVGSDVCGFFGNSTATLCARWMQLGAFYPFYRNHNGIGYMPQEPYSFGTTVTDISRHALQVRYSLLTYYYSTLIEVSLFGGTFIDSLGFVFPGDATARHLDTQFLVSKSLMVAPVLEDSSLEHSVYFPAITWYDYFTGEIAFNATSEPAGWKDFDDIRLGDMFVYVQAGSIIIQQEPAQTSVETKLNPITFVVALFDQQNKTSSTSLYIDDGETIDSEYSMWEINALTRDSGVGEFNFEFVNKAYQEDPLVIDQIIVYGVSTLCNTVLFEGTESLDFEYNEETKILRIELNKKSMFQSFQIVWGNTYIQPLSYKIIMFFGSLGFTVTLLSLVAVLIYICRKKSFCKPPSWLAIPDVPEVPEYREDREKEPEGEEMEEMITLED